MNEEKKIRVIYIMDDTPPYEMYRNLKRPEINWNLENGNWAGIWGYDWGNVLGGYVLQNDDEFSFEIRQPDLRADKIYEHKFNNNTVHKLYPASYDSSGKHIISDLLVKDLIESKNPRTILHIGVPGRFASGYIDKINTASKIGSFHGEIILPINNLFILRKNIFNYWRLIKEHIKFKKIINSLNTVTYQSESGLEMLKRYYHGRLEKITMGIDFNMFRKMDKTECRRELNLPADKKILISVGRITGLKRQSEVINELIKIKDRFDFLYIVIGLGSEKEEEYIHKLARPLTEESKILFPGYIRNEELVKYFNSADALLMTSSSEAGPVVSMEAIACEIPVISTDTGNVSEYLKKENAGIIIDRKNLKNLDIAIKTVMEGKEIKICDRNRAKEIFDWNIIAKKFIKIYRNSINSGL
ncbi:MAG: glycosyltransferase family 4 protein [Ignavibacteria bacterium]|nr:glycosyltransferase family 4 protein [Ignavibacteria bacterium]